ncbi:glycosyltransferase family 4 protein [Hyalangium versicolor]|uniref:glycosyltransferase family 4 protein n=1 Tax=Hyalangium versicolor TaxID=2861190 RepID=UPI001CCEA257|nr:glycosyltransferase family 4 protein [Hyalangium versicolor]
MLTPVLHVRSSGGLYGAERSLLALAAHTPPPYAPLLLSLVAPGRPDALVPEARKLGLKALRIPARSGFDAEAIQALASEARRLSARLFHAHDFKALALALPAARWAGLPVVATFHGDTGENLLVQAYEASARLLANAAQGVATVSRDLEARVRRWAPLAHVVHLPNGLALPPPLTAAEAREARRTLHLSETEPVLAVLGRLSPEKGHAVLFEALRRLPRPPLLLIAGEGPERARLEVLARGLPVRWLGFTASRPVYAASDAVVMPSLTEGMPMVALEAMASGRRVVASTVGELPYLLAQGRGELVPPSHPHLLSLALARVLRSVANSGRDFRDARAHVEGRYTPEAVGRRYADELYTPAVERYARISSAPTSPQA